MPVGVTPPEGPPSDTALCGASAKVHPESSSLWFRPSCLVRRSSVTRSCDVSIIYIYSGIVLAITAAVNLFVGPNTSITENVAVSWVTHIRNVCFRRVLCAAQEVIRQDRAARTRPCDSSKSSSRTTAACVCSSPRPVFRRLGDALSR